MTPEARARLNIDELLTRSDWIIFNHKQANIHAGCGVVIREFPLAKGHGTADYLLYVNGKAVGIIEAKKEGSTLRGVEVQSRKYSEGLPTELPAWQRPLPFLYESTGIETHFSNGLDPIPRARSIFAFHRPETLADWLNQSVTGIAETPPDYLKKQTFLARMQNLPPLNQDSLWVAQIKAIEGLENSLKNNQPRTLVQMATGSGKTFTAINLCYRLVKFAKAKRILFLVDRGNLGTQTLKEFQQYQSPYNNFKFTEEYIVQQLSSNSIDESARVCICTIQRMFSMLKGVELTEQEEQASSEELADLFKKPPPIEYNPAIPIETFDIIIIDECHRSIYNLWAQVLDYFDAYLIGLTATPNKQTFGFFNQNLVMEYNHEQAVVDGVNVPFDVFPITTELTKNGSVIEKGFHVEKQNRETRAKRWEKLDDNFEYSGNDIDRKVVAIDQIRTIIKYFKENLFTQLFPYRSSEWIPKTLIFAKDDNHAEHIVEIVREVFNQGNECVQKITYKTTGARPEDLIKAFRTKSMPRIAVTVDMIATGTDIKAIEIVFFMRSVKSNTLFEQMKGRGVRVINPEDLQEVTPDATVKNNFVIVDAVGVCETAKNGSYTLDIKPTVSFEKLLTAIGLGSTEEAAITSLASRLAKLQYGLNAKDHELIKKHSNGLTLKELSHNLFQALNPDYQIEQAKLGNEQPPEKQLEITIQRLKQEAVKPFSNPDLRNLLEGLRQQKDIIIDRISKDIIIPSPNPQPEPVDSPETIVKTFEQYIEEHKDEITALQILFNRPYSQRLDLKAIKELAEQIEKPPYHLTKDNVWKAYATLGKSKDSAKTKRLLTDLISLCRFAAHQDNELIPFAEKVQTNFNSWLAGQRNQGIAFTEQQLFWLEKIRDHITGSVSIDTNAFDYGVFAQAGGLGAFYDSFGDDYERIIEQLNTALVA